MQKKVISFPVEENFFQSRGKVKNPRGPKKNGATNLIEDGQKKAIVKKRFSKGNAYQHTNSGARSDLDGLVVRSNWEANVIRVLMLFKIKFEFEPIQFPFPPQRPGGNPSAYLPDILLTDTDEFIEVKGYLDARGRNKIRKFRKHYPAEFAKLTVIISSSNKANNVFFNKIGVRRILYYEHISKLYAPKVNWEGAR